MLRSISIIQMLVLILCVAAMGCSSDREETRGNRVPVDGIITLDGTHLEAGRIVFITNQGSGEVKATASVVKGYYGFDVENGPLTGQARVEIYPQEMELEQFESARDGDPSQRIDFIPVRIPAKYNVRSTLTAEVQSDAENNLIRFDLLSK